MPTSARDKRRAWLENLEQNIQQGNGVTGIARHEDSVDTLAITSPTSSILSPSPNTPTSSLGADETEQMNRMLVQMKKLLHVAELSTVIDEEQAKDVLVSLQQDAQLQAPLNSLLDANADLFAPEPPSPVAPIPVIPASRETFVPSSSVPVSSASTTASSFRSRLSELNAATIVHSTPPRPTSSAFRATLSTASPGSTSLALLSLPPLPPSASSTPSKPRAHHKPTMSTIGHSVDSLDAALQQVLLQREQQLAALEEEFRLDEELSAATNEMELDTYAAASAIFNASNDSITPSSPSRAKSSSQPQQHQPPQQFDPSSHPLHHQQQQHAAADIHRASSAPAHRWNEEPEDVQSLLIVPQMLHGYTPVQPSYQQSSSSSAAADSSTIRPSSIQISHNASTQQQQHLQPISPALSSSSRAAHWSYLGSPSTATTAPHTEAPSSNASPFVHDHSHNKDAFISSQHSSPDQLLKQMHEKLISSTTAALEGLRSPSVLSTNDTSFDLLDPTSRTFQSFQDEIQMLQEQVAIERSNKQVLEERVFALTELFLAQQFDQAEQEELEQQQQKTNQTESQSTIREEVIADEGEVGMDEKAASTSPGRLSPAPAASSALVDEATSAMFDRTLTRLEQSEAALSEAHQALETLNHSLQTKQLALDELTRAAELLQTLVENERQLREEQDSKLREMTQENAQKQQALSEDFQSQLSKLHESSTAQEREQAHLERLMEEEMSRSESLERLLVQREEQRIKEKRAMKLLKRELKKLKEKMEHEEEDIGHSSGAAHAHHHSSSATTSINDVAMAEEQSQQHANESQGGDDSFSTATTGAVEEVHVSAVVDDNALADAWEAGRLVGLEEVSLEAVEQEVAERIEKLNQSLQEQFEAHSAQLKQEVLEQSRKEAQAEMEEIIEERASAYAAEIVDTATAEGIKQATETYEPKLERLKKLLQERDAQLSALASYLDMVGRNTGKSATQEESAADAAEGNAPSDPSAHISAEEFEQQQQALDAAHGEIEKLEVMLADLQRKQQEEAELRAHDELERSAAKSTEIANAVADAVAAATAEHAQALVAASTEELDASFHEGYTKGFEQGRLEGQARLESMEQQLNEYENLHQQSEALRVEEQAEFASRLAMIQKEVDASATAFASEKAQIDSTHNEAYNEAYNKAYEQGLQDARSKHTDALHELKSQLEALGEALKESQESEQRLLKAHALETSQFEARLKQLEQTRLEEQEESELKARAVEQLHEREVESIKGQAAQDQKQLRRDFEAKEDVLREQLHQSEQAREAAERLVEDAERVRPDLELVSQHLEELSQALAAADQRIEALTAELANQQEITNEALEEAKMQQAAAQADAEASATEQEPTEEQLETEAQTARESESMRILTAAHEAELASRVEALESAKASLLQMRDNWRFAVDRLEEAQAAHREREKYWLQREAEWLEEKAQLHEQLAEREDQLQEALAAVADATAAAAEAQATAASSSSSSVPAPVAQPRHSPVTAEMSAEVESEVARLKALIASLQSSLDRSELHLKCKEIECTTLTSQMTALREELNDPATVAHMLGKDAASDRSESWSTMEVLFALQMLAVALFAIAQSPVVQDAFNSTPFG